MQISQLTFLVIFFDTLWSVKFRGKYVYSWPVIDYNQQLDKSQACWVHTHTKHLPDLNVGSVKICSLVDNSPSVPGATSHSS